MSTLVLMAMVTAVTAVINSPAATLAASLDHVESKILGDGPARAPLAKTWTTGVQENEEGSQVPANSVLASPVSFRAEGKGFEPSTGCPAPDFESSC